VFGCGGDRDRGKRPEMGRIAELYADHVIVTSDNPRTEPVEKIIEDILAGMRSHTVEIQPDRTLAIRSAVLKSKPSDTVLIAGKGHETYQEIGNQRLPFSDRQLVRNLLEGRA
jgi:UDP-N-acetylmuramoyl-L-alanyl-D-glutamate--2,6-diaminopimelate ligase